MKDNWIDVDMICGTCFYFQNFRCKRHAPTITGFPATFTTDWCGDHKFSKDTMRKLEKSNKSEVPT